MAITFVQTAGTLDFQFTSPFTSPAFTAGAGDYLGVLAASGNASFPTTSVTGSGSFAINGAHHTDVDNDDISIWQNTAATSGSQTIVATSSVGHSETGLVFEYSGVGSAGTPVYTNNAAPGTGAGAIVGAAVTVPTGSVLVAIVYDSTSVTSTTTITAVAGTSRLSVAGDNSTQPILRVQEYAGSGASITPAFTTNVGADNFVVTQILLSPPMSLGYVNHMSPGIR